MDRETVLTLYGSGVAAVVGAVDGWTDAQWARPACGEWSGTDLAGHLVTVISWYHDWLDRAIGGDAAPAFDAGALDERTALSLAALPPGTGPDRIDDFAASAARYARRLADHWDLPYGYPRGTVTAGLHAALASWEWHVHAWDLATAVGGDHRPADPATLYDAGMDCFATATGTDPRVRGSPRRVDRAPPPHRSHVTRGATR